MRFEEQPEDDVAHMIGRYAYRRPSYGETTCLSPFDASSFPHWLAAFPGLLACWPHPPWRFSRGARGLRWVWPDNFVVYRIVSKPVLAGQALPRLFDMRRLHHLMLPLIPALNGADDRLCIRRIDLVVFDDPMHTGKQLHAVG